MNRATEPAAIGRVLVLGQLPEVLETVLQELVALGVDAAGTTEAESAPERFDARAFDLIAFGGGLRGPIEERLKGRFADRHPPIRFLDVYAPLAARQIVDALRGPRPPEVDLDAYCARIGYQGPLTPTLDTLGALQAHHIAAIPFEAIDALIGRPIDISPAAVDAKLIGRRRGGYCFEQNGLFRRVLAAIGFEVEALLARVRWMAPAGSPPRPRTHLALRVTIDGRPWLADVGFGGCVPPMPLRMDVTAPQPTRHETFRLFPFGPGWIVQARLGDRWEALYELSPEPQHEADFELANWFTSAHPGSHFRHRLIAARTTAEARYALLGRRLTIRRPGRLPEERQLDAAGIEQLLADSFGLEVEPDWRAVIARAAAAIED